MQKNRLKDILLISLLLAFALMSIYSGVISQNIIHTEHCNINNCHLCYLINIATSFINNFGLIMFNTFILILTVQLLMLVNKNVKKNNRKTLVELKVILNN